jgi:cytochrome c oxidase subunit 2
MFYFSDTASVSANLIFDFYDHIMFYIYVIFGFVFFFCLSIVCRYSFKTVFFCKVYDFFLIFFNWISILTYVYYMMCESILLKKMIVYCKNLFFGFVESVWEWLVYYWLWVEFYFGVSSVVCYKIYGVLVFLDVLSFWITRIFWLVFDILGFVSYVIEFIICLMLCWSYLILNWVINREHIMFFYDCYAYDLIRIGLPKKYQNINIIATKACELLTYWFKNLSEKNTVCFVSEVWISFGSKHIISFAKENFFLAERLYKNGNFLTFLILSLNFFFFRSNNILRNIGEYYLFSFEMYFNYQVIEFDENLIRNSIVLELFWTILPAFVLVLIGIPSYWTLFCVDELINPVVTLKCIGNQWYWTYEYGQFDIQYDSYMIQEDELEIGGFRLLEVDNCVVLPVKVPVRLLVTSSDVIHSWAVPAFGVKVDGIPGRLNQFSLYLMRTGVFFGQCSELCGVNHGFMPIKVEVVSFLDFVKFLEARGANAVKSTIDMEN